MEDYGIYNVVGGVVTMFGFISGCMSTATQRYLTFELGKGRVKRLQEVFNVSILIHGIVALVILVVAETIGLWFYGIKCKYLLDVLMLLYGFISLLY